MKFIKKPRAIIVSLLLLGIIVTGFILFSDNNNPGYDFVIVERKNLIQEVSITGRVKPLEAVELAFERSGKITRLYAQVGDRILRGQKLIELNNADLTAQLSEAEANVQAQRANLDELRHGTRREEILIQEARIEEARQNLIDKIHDAYTKSDDAVRNKIDQFFSNPRSSNPQINIFVNDVQLETDIKAQRINMENLLNSWTASLTTLDNSENLSAFVLTVKNNLNLVKSFLDKVALAINTASGNAYRTDAAAARTSINAAIDNLSAAASNLIIQEKELALKKSGARAEEITAQEAQVLRAEANTANIKAQIDKTILRSPINGILTRKDVEIGEITASNEPIVSIITNEFKVEANVPEADFAELKIGASAKVTLDAYGNDAIFETKIIAIDPAETIVEGVPTYKTTFRFVNQDERIKSGMTANIDVLTGSKENVLAIPQRAVIVRNGEKFVRLVNENLNSDSYRANLIDTENPQIKEAKVKTGLRGSDGTIEIIEGLDEGDKVIIESGD